MFQINRPPPTNSDAKPCHLSGSCRDTRGTFPFSPTPAPRTAGGRATWDEAVPCRTGRGSCLGLEPETPVSALREALFCCSSPSRLCIAMAAPADQYSPVVWVGKAVALSPSAHPLWAAGSQGSHVSPRHLGFSTFKTELTTRGLGHFIRRLSGFRAKSKWFLTKLHGVGQL